MIAEIQARHDHALKHGFLTTQDFSQYEADHAWLLSDRKRLEDQIIGEQTAYNIAATDLENARDAILHKDLAIKSLEIINREQETEIRLLRKAVNISQTFISMFADDDARRCHEFDDWKESIAALSKFDKVKA